jgi:hypothetical protein
MADVTEPVFWKYWGQKLLSLKSQCHDITNKYPGAASVVQQAYKVLSGIAALKSFANAPRPKWENALSGQLL